MIATGQTHSVRELCDVAFGHLGLDYQAYVKEDECFFRPAEAVPLVGDAGKVRGKLHWQPSVTFQQLIEMMVDADLQDLG